MVVWLLQKLVGKDKLVIHILDAVEARQLNAIIDVNADGEMTISGKTVDIEKGNQLRAHARAGLENKAFALIREQVVYEAFTGAATKAMTGDDLLFYRAALWWEQRVQAHLQLLAGRNEPDIIQD